LASGGLGGGWGRPAEPRGLCTIPPLDNLAGTVAGQRRRQPGPWTGRAKAPGGEAGDGAAPAVDRRRCVSGGMLTGGPGRNVPTVSPFWEERSIERDGGCARVHHGQRENPNPPCTAAAGAVCKRHGRVMPKVPWSRTAVSPGHGWGPFPDQEDRPADDMTCGGTAAGLPTNQAGPVTGAPRTGGFSRRGEGEEERAAIRVAAARRGRHRVALCNVAESDGAGPSARSGRGAQDQPGLLLEEA